VAQQARGDALGLEIVDVHRVVVGPWGGGGRRQKQRFVGRARVGFASRTPCGASVSSAWRLASVPIGVSGAVFEAGDESQGPLHPIGGVVCTAGGCSATGPCQSQGRTQTALQAPTCDDLPAAGGPSHGPDACGAGVRAACWGGQGGGSGFRG
jgi:hypothetical protein